MDKYRFKYPMAVRFGDLDPQWHVNNARLVTMLEQARFAYLVELGLFDGQSFIDLGWIVADLHVAYTAPIEFLEKLMIGVRVSRLGNKSMTVEYHFSNAETGEEKALAETVMVAYDYHTKQSMPIPSQSRARIAEYENIPEFSSQK